jgi:sigma-B regulation protein RsbU (phosphoserine phosphatase)
MQEKTMEHIKESLSEKRAALNEWLDASQKGSQADLCCPEGPEPVLAHLATVDQAIAKAKAGTLGVCTVCGEVVEDRLLEVDYTACVCLTHLSGEELTHLEDEIALAGTVQKALLPEETPSIPGLEVAAYSRPAEFVGGDYFDFIDFRAGTHGLLIADVAGHGVSAGLQMANLQALARAIIPTTDSPTAVVRRLDGLLRHNIRFTTFVSLFIGAFDAKARTLSYCNAGHNPPLIWHEEQGKEPAPHWLDPTGPAIALVEEAHFDGAVLHLQAGDVLVLYTDGVVEATDRDNNFFGTRSLVSAVQRSHQSAPREIIHGIRQSIEEFRGGRPLADDVTLVVCKVAS